MTAPRDRPDRDADPTDRPATAERDRRPVPQPETDDGPEVHNTGLDDDPSAPSG